jgi:hypothetical protein
MIPKRKELPPLPPVTQPPPICTFPIWKHTYSGSSFVRLAGLFGASAVALGAYGAHGKFTAIKKLRVFDSFLNVFDNAAVLLSEDEGRAIPRNVVYKQGDDGESPKLKKNSNNI